MTRNPKVSVIISNHNGLKLNLLTTTVKVLLGNNYPDLEIILVDNASTDGSVEKSRKLFGSNGRFKIVENPLNMYSQGLNLGIKSSSGKYVFFFNNDAVVSDGFFQKYIQFLEKNPEIALSQGKLVSYFDHSVIDSAGETMDKYGNPITIGQGSKSTDAEFNKVTEVLSVSGSCSVIRRNVAVRLGGFDDSYGIGYEDLDMALRVWEAGYRVVYYPEVTAYHKRGSTDLSDMVRIKVRWHFNKNRLTTLLKHFSIEFLLVNLPFTLMIYLTVSLNELRQGKSALAMTRFTSIAYVISKFPDIIKVRSVIRKRMNPKTEDKILNLLSNRSVIDAISVYRK
jgi:GT2 family glycosyltransferase